MRGRKLDLLGAESGIEGRGGMWLNAGRRYEVDDVWDGEMFF